MFCDFCFTFKLLTVQSSMVLLYISQLSVVLLSLVESGQSLSAIRAVTQEKRKSQTDSGGWQLSRKYIEMIYLKN